LLILAFGLFIPTLGFYWDDWPVLITHKLLGNAGLWEFYTYDRPVSAWTYIVMLPVLGYSPLPWHIFTLLLRWATCLGLWLALRGVWPTRTWEIAGVTALFAIYPVFKQQAISVAYSQHWITYLLYFASLAGMVYAVQRRRYFWPLTVFSLLAAALHLFTMEFFAGLELARPFVLWLALMNVPGDTRARLRRSVMHYLPYLAVLAAFLIWRLFLLELPGEDINRPALLLDLQSSPFSTAIALVVKAVQDVEHVLAGVWGELFDPRLIDQMRPISLLFWFAALVSGAAAFFYLSSYQQNEAAASALQKDQWPRLAMSLGLLVILLGMLPVWLSGRDLIVGLYDNRFGLPAMFGAALFWVGLLRWLVADRRKQTMLLGIMIALSVGMHLRTANDYRWSWIAQQRFYWQFYWRAPAIEPHTAIYSDGEIFPYVGWYSTAFGINLLYPEGQSEQLKTWFFSLGREIDYSMGEFLSGKTLEQGLRNFTFTGYSKEGIVIHYHPYTFDCLVALSPEDAEIPDLPQITRQALPNSDLGRILDQPSPLPSTAIFGPEPDHGWCYFFQKASLAAQFEDWDQVVRLGDEAAAQGYRPDQTASDTPHEWLPFVQGYALTGQIERASQISRAMLTEDTRINVRLCQLWSKISQQVDVRDALQEFECNH
jgi:hypothetical protein